LSRSGKTCAERSRDEAVENIEMKGGEEAVNF